MIVWSQHNRRHYKYKHRHTVPRAGPAMPLLLTLLSGCLLCFPDKMVRADPPLAAGCAAADTMCPDYWIFCLHAARNTLMCGLPTVSTVKRRRTWQTLNRREECLASLPGPVTSLALGHGLPHIWMHLYCSCNRFVFNMRENITFLMSDGFRINWKNKQPPPIKGQKKMSFHFGWATNSEEKITSESVSWFI